MAAAMSVNSATSNGSVSIHCFERAYWGRQAKAPVSLVIFDFDETLTTVSAFPKEPEFEKRIGFQLWEEYTHWCYEPAHCQETFDGGGQPDSVSRVSKLHAMLRDIVGSGNQKRTLAVITRNTRGVVACLNSLMSAGLAEYFSVILGMQDIRGLKQGVYRHGFDWKAFHPPVMRWGESKADILSRIVDDPKQWFPQLALAAEGGEFAGLRGLKLANIVLVDDDEDNFQSPSTKVLRCCKVNTYAAHHPTLGFQEDMGGIGANCDDDYATLVDFVEQPWKFPWHHRGAADEGGESAETRTSQPMGSFRSGGGTMERGNRTQADAHVSVGAMQEEVGPALANNFQATPPNNFQAAPPNNFQVAPPSQGYMPQGFVGYVLMPVPAVPFQGVPYSPAH